VMSIISFSPLETIVIIFVLTGIHRNEKQQPYFASHGLRHIGVEY
jgi:hypothetical protein